MTAAIIIATEKNKGNESFLLSKLGEISPLQRLVKTFEHAGVQHITVICDDNCSEIKRELSKTGVICISSNIQKPSDIQSIRFGLCEVGESFDKILITPAHTPLFCTETVTELLSADSLAAAPKYGDKFGFPIVLCRGSALRLTEYLKEQADAGDILSAIRSADIDIGFIDSSDEGVVFDIRHATEYNNLIASHNLNKLHPKFQIYLSKERRFYGPGPHKLIELLGDTKSLRTACDKMGISYSKGWKIIAEIERNVGREVVTRKRGGSDHGHSELTEYGRKLAENYRAFSEDVDCYVQKAFCKYFSED